MVSDPKSYNNKRDDAQTIFFLAKTFASSLSPFTLINHFAFFVGPFLTFFTSPFNSILLNLYRILSIFSNNHLFNLDIKSKLILLLCQVKNNEIYWTRNDIMLFLSTTIVRIVRSNLSLLGWKIITIIIELSSFWYL